MTGILKSEWAASASEMEIFVSDSFVGRGSQTFLYLAFDEGEELYKQLDAFLKSHQLSFEEVEGNDEVIQYLAGEKPDSIADIIKFGLAEDGNFTYIILKLQSDYNLACQGMIVLLCLFSLFVIYSVFSISVSKRISEYGILQTLGISEAQIGKTLVLELWILFFVGYPLGCFAGNGLLSLMYQRLSGVFGGKGIGISEKGLSVADQTLAEGIDTVKFYLSWEGMSAGFLFLLITLSSIYGCSFFEKTITEGSYERRCFFCKKKKNLCASSGQYGREIIIFTERSREIRLLCGFRKWKDILTN